MIRVRSITLPNLIAGRRLFPEWVVSFFPKRDAANIAAVLNDWLTDRKQLARKKRELEDVCETVVKPGATARAAELILNKLNSGSVEASSSAQAA
jgi:lipid-A-disaccharide synthase